MPDILPGAGISAHGPHRWVSKQLLYPCSKLCLHKAGAGVQVTWANGGPGSSGDWMGDAAVAGESNLPWGIFEVSPPWKCLRAKNTWEILPVERIVRACLVAAAASADVVKDNSFHTCVGPDASGIVFHKFSHRSGCWALPRKCIELLNIY